MKKEIKTGYKVTDANMQCRNFQFELKKVFTQDGEIRPCSNGFHYCSVLVDCFEYYKFSTENRVFEIQDLGDTKVEGDKSCTSKIKFIRELSWLEVLELVNTGKGNTGIKNAGNRNAGNRNAGSDNAGSDNAGNRNAGNRNAGYSNAGSDNAGNRNAGSDNAGSDNAGSYNAGNRNAGYSNAGSDNAGAFNNSQANYVMFNKPSDWSFEDFKNSRAFDLLTSISTTIWIPSYKMTDQEKIDHPYHVTTEGYTKHLPYKEAFTNAWHNWTDSSKQTFKDLPNFDWTVFTDITGVTEDM